MGQCVSSPAVSGETEQQMRARWEAAPDGLGACAPREPVGGASPHPKPKIYTTTVRFTVSQPLKNPFLCVSRAALNYPLYSYL
jgi:hypothetical protein